MLNKFLLCGFLSTSCLVLLSPANGMEMDGEKMKKGVRKNPIMVDVNFDEFGFTHGGLILTGWQLAMCCNLDRLETIQGTFSITHLVSPCFQDSVKKAQGTLPVIDQFDGKQYSAFKSNSEFYFSISEYFQQEDILVPRYFSLKKI